MIPGCYAGETFAKTMDLQHLNPVQNLSPWVHHNPHQAGGLHICVPARDLQSVAGMVSSQLEQLKTHDIKLKVGQNIWDKDAPAST